MSTVIINPAAVAQLFRSPMGPVMRYEALVAQKVQDGAKQKVGVSAEAGEGPHPHLRDTIVKRFISTSTGPAWRVGSELSYARLHHDGTPPHVIVPRNASVLRFPTKGGTIVFARRVNHPGTKPNRYLTDVATALGLRVVRKT